MATEALRPSPGDAVLGLDQPGSASRSLVVAVSLGCAAVAAIAVFAIAFASVALPVVPGFTLSYVTAYVLIDLVTVVLLAQHGLVGRSRSIAALLAAYVFSGVVAVTFLLSFPGAFTDGVLVGGTQSSIWQFYLLRIGFMALVGVSSWLVLRPPSPGRDRHTRTGPWLLVGLALAVPVGLAALAASSALPVLIVPGPPDVLTGTFRVVSWVSIAVSLVAVAITVAAARTGARLRVWLVMVTVLVLADSVIQLPATGRYTLGWYTPRVLGVIGAAVLLAGLITQVSRQARALATATAESARLAQIVEQSPLGYVRIDAARRITGVNESLCELTGFTPSDLIGRSIGPLLDPEEAQGLTSIVDGLLASGSGSATLRTRIARRDGSQQWVSAYLHPLVGTDGVVGLAARIADATDEVTADLDASAPVGLATLSADGLVSHANAALSAMTGRTRAELTGALFADLVHPDDRAEDERHVSALVDGEAESTTIEVRLLRPDSDPLWVSLYRSVTRSPSGAPTSMTVQVIDVSARRQAEETALRATEFLQHRSTYDDLTGLLNRPTLVDRLQTELDFQAVTGPTAVLLVDIDGFQQVANAMTRVQGDAVIAALAHHLEDLAGPDALVARVGGDEFALAVPVDDVPAAESLAERILRDTAEARYGQPGHEVQLTVCLGMTIGGHLASAADLLQEADLATRQSKARGRRTLTLFDRTMRTDVLARLDLTERIRAALGTREFRAWYQPIVRLPHGDLVGYEALSRWVTPDRTIPPDQYLPIAEDTGLIIDIGARTMDQALAALSGLPVGITMSVNASPTELIGGDVTGQIRDGLARHHVDPSRVIVEITEQALFDARRADAAQLARLADLGVGLHVDDFGTGYSSITHIRDFPITGIKLDRSFTSDAAQGNPRAIEIAGVLGELADRLSLTAVAEGIETAEQAHLVESLGWTHGQGWLYGRPAPEPAPVDGSVRE